GPGGPGRRHRRGAQPGAADPAGGEGALAADPQLGHQHRSGVRPKRTAVVELYTAPPPGSVVICADELGPVVPRACQPAPGWSPGGHRVKAPLEDSRGPRRPGGTAGCAYGTGRRSPCAPRPGTAPSTRTSSSWPSRPTPTARSG